MGISAQVITAVVGSPDGATVCGRRRRVDNDDIRWAEAKRALGWGWQAIALARRVNQTDLMMHCGALPRPVKPQAPAAPRAGRPLAVLRACAAGAKCYRDIQQTVDAVDYEICAIIGRLKREGCLTGGGRKRAGWTVTAIGRDRLEAADA